MSTDRVVHPPLVKRMFPKYTYIEWLLLAAMAAMIAAIPLALSRFFPVIAWYAVFALVIGLAMNAFFWQDPRSMFAGHNVWIGTFILGAVIAIVGPFTHALHMVIMTGIICMYMAPWSMLRLVLRKKFLNEK